MVLERIIYIITNWPIYGLQFCLPYLVVFFGLKNRKYLDEGLRIVLYAFISWLILDLGVWYIAINKENNYWLINIQEIVFSGLVIIGFTEFFKKQQLYFLIAFFLIQYFVYHLPDQGFEKYLVHAANRLLFLGFSIYFFFRTMERMEVPKITAYPWFWIFAGFLVYSASTVITYILSEFTITVVDENPVNNFFKVFNIAFSFILYLLTAIGFYKTKTYSNVNG